MAADATTKRARPGHGPLLRVRNLVKHFPVKDDFTSAEPQVVRAVDGVSFDVQEGEVLGVVGESGCGKSTTARLLMGIIRADDGDVFFEDHELGRRGGISVKDFYRHAQMVFQDSYSSLNPRLPIEETISFSPIVHGVKQAEARERARGLLRDVGLHPDRFGRRYPHELSGGQRQRVNIARALAIEPRLVFLDEAVSALDKSVEAQVLNLLIDLKAQRNLTYVFISHDLNVVQYISDRVLVMYLGRIVEVGPVQEIYDRPTHPYTQALLASRLSMNPDDRKDVSPLTGDPPTPINPPSGCRFRTRCAFVEDVCARRAPALQSLPTAEGHAAACHMSIPGSGHSRAATATATADASP